ncbi:unnamed protein product [Ambrosiozyma monospora]|uniref:Unnamed protein product n=1 Tax=Ambrosiozyma monospora TaxID=43982 RepID=A0ACB5TRV4_AMBMO|nr:unnamed protein product [Ambrosiozyma monospora]
MYRIKKLENQLSFEVLIDSICELMTLILIMSPTSSEFVVLFLLLVSFYTESDEPRTTCPSTWSSIVVPVPIHPVIFVPDDEASTENVPRSFRATLIFVLFPKERPN